MLTGLLFLALSFACADPAPVPEVPRTCLDNPVDPATVPDVPLAFATEHLDIHLDEGRYLCEGSAIEYERFAQYVAGQLGIEIQRRIPVYLLDSNEGYCDKPSQSCVTPRGVVYSYETFIYHELTHGVACEIRTGAPAMLAEGLAVAYDHRSNKYPGVPEDIAEIHTSEFGMYYNDAGHFVRWLLETYGTEPFVEAYRTVSYDGGVWAGLQEIYGENLEAEYEATTPAMWIQHRQCADMPVLPPDAEGNWLFSTRFDCSDEATLGPYEKDSTSFAGTTPLMFQSVIVDIEEPGLYQLQHAQYELNDQSGYLYVQVERCLDEDPATEEEIDSEWNVHFVWFTFQGGAEVEFPHPGRWRLDIGVVHGPPQDVWLQIGPRVDG
ncbi:MAG: hypothetical protein KC457_21890 [Myxococcales bacterium]|nr:hypothetical protein [Myxococcales bacterium]